MKEFWIFFGFTIGASEQFELLTREPCDNNGPSSLCHRQLCWSSLFGWPEQNMDFEAFLLLTVRSWQSIWVGTSAQCFFVFVTMLQPLVGNDTVSFICFSFWGIMLQSKCQIVPSTRFLTTSHFGTLYSKHFLAWPCSHLRTGTVNSSGLYSICNRLEEGETSHPALGDRVGDPIALHLPFWWRLDRLRSWHRHLHSSNFLNPIQTV